MKRLLIIALPLILSACTLIYDDLSVCRQDVLLTYRLQLHAELSVQLQTELAAAADEPVRQILESWFTPVFEDSDIDVDLRFYSIETDALSERRQEVLKDRRTSFTITLPKEDFMHLAVANIGDDNPVQLKDVEQSSTMRIELPEQTEVSSLSSMIYTARMPIIVTDSTEEVHVALYAITGAVALVMQTDKCSDLIGVSGRMRGLASEFSVKDSTFSYDRSPLVSMTTIPMDAPAGSMHRARTSAGDYACMAGVGMPTQDGEQWQIELTTTLTDNRHTTTTLTVNEPLTAGELHVIKLEMDKDGGLYPVSDTEEVGAAVELDWNKGDEHEIEL